MGVDLLLKYFPTLEAKQVQQLEALNHLYQDWNQKINVVSRKDVELLYERHVLHSLAIAKIVQFQARTKIMDVGTGGGFPGIPLAILFPDTDFYLVDSIGKKIRVVEEVVKGLNLANVRAQQIRMEEVSETFDFIINRAVAPLRTLLHWTKQKVQPGGLNNLANGLICLKGGDLASEIQEAKVQSVQLFNIKDFFEEEFFETKKILYLPL